jgi:hypothetical protein
LLIWPASRPFEAEFIDQLRCVRMLQSKVLCWLRKHARSEFVIRAFGDVGQKWRIIPAIARACEAIQGHSRSDKSAGATAYFSGVFF